MNNYPRGRKRGLQIRLAMTDRDVVERFAALMGVGRVRRRQRSNRPNEKPIFEWYVYEAAEVARIIEMLRPWFGERRSARAAEMLEVARDIGLHKGKRTHCPQGHPYAGDNLMVEKATGARRCRICRQKKERDRARKRLGVKPENYRAKE